MKSILTLLLFCVGVSFSNASGIGLELVSAARDSDAIIYCKIVEIRPSNDSKFGKIAKAEVLDSSKGLKKGDVALLLFDNGLGCPNVSYSINEEVLVFAKLASSGSYETMNLYCGRFSVESGIVRSFYLFTGFPPKAEDIPVSDVLARIRNAVPKQKTESLTRRYRQDTCLSRVVLRTPPAKHVSV